MSFPLNDGFEDRELAEVLAKAKEESLRYYQEVELPRQQRIEQKQENDILSLPISGEAGCLLYEGIEAKGFHLSAGCTYTYPTNYPLRQYQASIVKTALFKNTLVSLPTGLGKTFIAAVVMYNFYRWYPKGKVVFMAPTRPLVAQQAKACHHVMNIPQNHTTEMTGAQSAEQRAHLWQEKRVFYLTPQVMVNDLKAKACPASLIKCIVLDEAHRATKDYAYSQVLKLLNETDAVFRVLGLSATPGNDINAVQEVIQNLHISAIEMRSEDSLDVVSYVHSRSIDIVVVDLSDNIQRVKEDLLQVYEKYAKKLKDFKALSSNISSISKFQVLKASEKFRANPPRGVPPAMIGSLISDFSVCMSLAHSLELLQIYGLRAFYNYLSDDTGEKTKNTSSRLKNDEHLKEMLNRLHTCLFPKNKENVHYTWGHPKLQKLVNALMEHFQEAEKKSESTKAIIFCQYRVVVSEIVELLSKCKPLIKATEFIGQSGGKDKGMPQAKQLQIMKDFRNGFINCLVATCVAEEGLDIGEVDLIILMEAHKSPIRLVQRIGRTGRKRKGKCIVLLTRGKEEQKFHSAMATRKSYVQNIVNAPAVKASLCQESPRMIPPQCNPVQNLVHINASNFESPLRPAGKKQADIRKCFTSQSTSYLLSDSDLHKAFNELGTTKITFKSIPKPQEFWHKQHGDKILIEELLSKDINGLSEWNEWNFVEQPEYYISHTLQSKLLCHLLKVSSKEITFPEYYHTLSHIGVIKEDEFTIKTPEKHKTKKFLKNNMGMDIRDCMAVTGDKNTNISPEKNTTEIYSDDSEGCITFNSAIGPHLKKLKLSSLEKDVPLIFNEKLTCVYEENNNICSILSNYLLPNVHPSSLVKKMTFDLPNLEILNNLSFDLLLNLSFNDIATQRNECGAIKSPCLIKIRSPNLNDFFEVDDLFEDNSGKENTELLHNSYKNCEIIKTGEICSLTPEFNMSNVNCNINWCLTPERNSVHKNYHIDMKTVEVRERDKDSSIGYLVKNGVTEQINSNADIIFNVEEAVSEDIKVANGTHSRQKQELHVTKASRSSPSINKDSILSKSDDKINTSTSIYDAMKIKNGTDKDINYINDLETHPADVTTGKLVEYSNNIGHQNKACTSLQSIQVIKASSPLGENEVILGNETKQHFGSEVLEPMSGIVCSTPLMSVKTFKKNVMKIENSVPLLVEEDEEKSKSFSSEEDPWNLSDLFEEEEDNNKNVHDSTMLGISQMVSLIERDKNKTSVSNSSAEASSSETEQVLNKTNQLFSMEYIDSEKSNGSEIAQHSQPVNFKKFSCKKILFPQQMITQYSTSKEFKPENFERDSNHHISISKNQSSFLDQNKENIHVLTHSVDFDLRHSHYKNQNKSFVSESSSCDSKEKRLKNKELEKTLNSTLKGCDSDCDEDLFLIPSKRKKEFISVGQKNILLMQETTSKPKLEYNLNDKSTRTKKKNRQSHNELIETEADVSGNDTDDDTDGSSLDDFDNSFINDNTECMLSQTMYLKSVKSPPGCGKFKIPNKINYKDNVFSQQVPEDSEYINDSFCVDSEEVTDDENEKSLSLLELAEQKLLKNNGSKSKHRRILQISSESPSPEKSFTFSKSCSQPSPISSIKRKKRRIQSDSDSEYYPEKESLSFKRKKKKIDISSDVFNLAAETSRKLTCGRPMSVKDTQELSQNPVPPRYKKCVDEIQPPVKHKNVDSAIDKSLQKLTETFSLSLVKIKDKFFGSDDSSE